MSKDYRYSPQELPAGFTTWTREDQGLIHIYHRPTKCHGRGITFMDALKDVDNKMVAFQSNMDNTQEYDDGSGPLRAAAKQGHAEDS